MADPGTELVVRIGVHAGYSCADTLHPCQELSAQAFKYFLSRSRRDKPHRTLKQVRVGTLDAGLLLPGHGMSSEIAAADVLAEGGGRTGKHFGFRAAAVGQQRLRRTLQPEAS